MIDLPKGANAPIAGAGVRLSLRTRLPPDQLDLCALLVGRDHQCRSDSDFVFYNQPKSPCGSTELVSPTEISVVLDKIPADVNAIVMATTLDERVPGNLSNHGDVVIEAHDGVTTIRHAFVGLTTERCVVAAEIYRRNGGWKLRAVSQGYDDLAGLIADFGVSADSNAPAPATPPAPEPSTTPAPSTPTARRSAPPVIPVQGTGPFDLWGQRGWCHREIAGVHHYKPQIRSILGPDHRPNGTTHEFVARLIPEPANPYDPHAVRVEILNQKVGYLPSDQSASFAPLLAQLVGSGHLPEVAAHVWAAEWEQPTWDEQDNETTETVFRVHIRLDLDEPHLLVPRNSPPSEPSALLPYGNSIQIHKTEPHFDILRDTADQHGQQWAWATLHEHEEQLTRTTRTIIQVHIDGAVIGQLTPKMSGELLPALKYANERSIVLTARALITCSRAAANVKLHTVRSHQLAESWFDQIDQVATNDRQPRP